MTDAPHVTRMRDELEALEKKAWDLGEFLKGSVVKTLDPLDEDLLCTQYAAMKAYAGILRFRLGRATA